MMILTKNPGNSSTELKLPTKLIRAIRFNVESYVMSNRKKAIPKAYKTAGFVPNQFTIVNKYFEVILGQHETPKSRTFLS